MKYRAFATRVLLSSLVACGARCGGRDATAAQPTYHVQRDLVTLIRKPSVTFETEPVSQGGALAAPAVPARVTTVEALTAPVFAPLNGRIAETLVRLGDRVERGDRLVEVRSSELPSLNQQVESAAAAARAKEAELARLERMVEARVGSEHDFLVARAELERLHIEVKAASSRRESLGVAPARDAASYFVIAPRAGTIVQLAALAGQVVGPERTSPLATVASIDEVLVVGDVPLRYAPDLRCGAPARVRLETDQTSEQVGVIEFVADVVDPERQTVPVRVRVDNRLRMLRPNAFVELYFEPDQSQPLLRVPSRAILSDGATSVVFVEVGAGKFERRAVTLGRQTSELTEIRQGLAPGERVVVNHALLLLSVVQGSG